MGDKEEGWRVARLLGFGQWQAQQRRCVGVEDEDAHIGLASQLKDVCQVARHTLAPVLLPYIPHFDSRNSGELAAPGGADG